MNRFSGRTAVVTGAASGIGAASAARLAAEGAAVLVSDIADEAGESVAAAIRADGGRAAYVRCDVSSEDDWTALRTEAHARFGPVGILHSNAFTHTPAAAHDLPVATWDREMAVNLRALYLATRTFLDDLRAERGSLVATSSVHADFGLPGYPAYAAAKGGMCALVRQFAVEYGPDVRFNSVLPGPILTDVWNDVDEEGRRLSADATALARLGRPEEVAAAVAFLASADAAYITGTNLVVDGGWTVKKDSK
ncbi:SDR family NAD(P)-dependent oxidoreductase [Streptomyces sp. NBC_00233]|uniref:SDR family NAD(P)-dependent oxidoreductase n=1 Tax=Streptomyces sp. NBC_00233 TaxID=2975686 RepID=UPI002254D232|nr:SDR family oxidoreductase [Streptomyces sp. NBC_00233]MCX5230139.1 SDR family oxidoreductase [Streptomyces sp. NBC_00233]